MVGLITNNPTRIGRQHYRRGEYLEVSEDQARAMTNSGTARYASGRAPEKPLVDQEGRSIRAFGIATQKAVAPSKSRSR